MNIITLDSKLWQPAIEHGAVRSDLERIVTDAAREAAQLLPSDFEYLNIAIGPTTPEWVIPETGAMGMTYSDEYISMTFDALLPHGWDKTKDALRHTTFHEMVHAATFARDPWQSSAMFGVVTEGLASIFERDYADSKPLWGQYESDDEMSAWYDELNALPAAKDKDREYFVEHGDGRKWIVYKTGAWVIDKLIANGEDLFDLMKLPHHDVIKKFEALP